MDEEKTFEEKLAAFRAFSKALLEEAGINDPKQRSECLEDPLVDRAMKAPWMHEEYAYLEDFPPEEGGKNVIDAVEGSIVSRLRAEYEDILKDAGALREGFDNILGYALQLKRELKDVLSVTDEVVISSESNRVVFAYKGLRLIFEIVLSQRRIQVLTTDYEGGPLIMVDKWINVGGKCIREEDMVNFGSGLPLSEYNVKEYIYRYLFR